MEESKGVVIDCGCCGCLLFIAFIITLIVLHPHIPAIIEAIKGH